MLNPSPSEPLLPPSVVLEISNRFGVFLDVPSSDLDLTEERKITIHSTTFETSDRVRKVILDYFNWLERDQRSRKLMLSQTEEGFRFRLDGYSSGEEICWSQVGSGEGSWFRLVGEQSKDGGSSSCLLELTGPSGSANPFSGAEDFLMKNSEELGKDEDLNLPFLDSNSGKYQINATFGDLLHRDSASSSSSNSSHQVESASSSPLLKLLRPPLSGAISVQQIQKFINSENEIQASKSLLFNPTVPEPLRHLDLELEEANKLASSSMSSNEFWSSSIADHKRSLGWDEPDAEFFRSKKLAQEFHPQILKELNWNGEVKEEERIRLVYGSNSESVAGSGNWKLILEYQERLVQASLSSGGKEVSASEILDQFEEEAEEADIEEEDGDEDWGFSSNSSASKDEAEVRVEVSLVEARWIKDGFEGEVLMPSCSTDFKLSSSKILPANLDALRSSQALNDWQISVSKDSTRSKEQAYKRSLSKHSRPDFEKVDEVPIPLFKSGRTDCPSVIFVESLESLKSEGSTREEEQLVLMDSQRISRTVWQLQHEGSKTGGSLIREYVRREGRIKGEVFMKIEWKDERIEDLPKWKELEGKLQKVLR